MNNEERDRALYKYPGTDVLKNKLALHDANALAVAERRLVRQRMEEGVPGGNFDLKHLQDIHRHLFQDVYEWAGELRRVDFHKTDWFLPYGRIEMGMADVHRRLEDQNFLKGQSKEQFATSVGQIIGDVNYAHPFREGNGRTQFQFLKQLGEQAGHEIDLTRFERDSWIEASIKANRGDYGSMAEQIGKAIAKPPEKSLNDLLQEALKATPEQDLDQTQDFPKKPRGGPDRDR